MYGQVNTQKFIKIHNQIFYVAEKQAEKRAEIDLNGCNQKH